MATVNGSPVTAAMVDELGQLCREVKPMNSRISFLKEKVFKLLAVGIYRGEAYEARITHSERRYLNPDKVRLLLTPEQFESCYEQTPVIHIDTQPVAQVQVLPLLQEQATKAKAKKGKVKHVQKSKARAA